MQFLVVLALTGGIGAATAAPAMTNAPGTSLAPRLSRATATPGSVTIGDASITYIARAGDTLISIARQYTERGSNWIALGKLNRIDKDSSIPIGTAILIPAELLGDTPSKATVVAMTGTIDAITADGTSTKLSLGATVLEGTQLETGGNSFLTLALPDHSRISLPSNTRVRFAKLRTARYLNSARTEVLLLRGQVESRVAPLEATRGRYEVRTPLSVAGVRGTHFRVGFVEASSPTRIATETLEGKVAVAHSIGPSGPDGLVLSAAKGNITDSRTVGPAVDLLPAPHLNPSPGSTGAEFPAARIAVQAVTGARAYHLQIAADAQAMQLLAESRSNSPTLAIANLPDGNYYARLSAIDGLGLEGLPAIQAITLRAASGVADSASNSSIGASTLTAPYVAGSNDKSVTLRWNQPTGQTVRLQVARDGEFTYMVWARVAAAGETQLQLPRPAFGTYYARVQLLDASGGVRNSSAAQSFIVTDQWIINDGNPVGVRQSRASANQ